MYVVNLGDSIMDWMLVSVLAEWHTKLKTRIQECRRQIQSNPNEQSEGQNTEVQIQNIRLG